MRYGKPWEGLYAAYTTVFKDGPKYRMYYRGMPAGTGDGDSKESTCYAESPDGINWTKPNLGLFTVMGTKDNNVVLAGMPPFSHNFAPMLDTRPGVAAEQPLWVHRRLTRLRLAVIPTRVSSSVMKR